MSTLVIKARSTIANPKYGKLKGLTEGVRLLLDARTLSLAQGASVNSWVGSGEGGASERTFSEKLGDWTYPKFDTVTRKSLRFDGTAILANNNLTDHLVTTSSYVIVAKAESLTSSAVQNRLFTGSASAIPNQGYQAVYPKSGGLVMQAAGDTIGKNIPINTSWFVGVFVFDGENSKFITSLDNLLVSNPRVTGEQDRISIGGNLNKGTHENGGFVGNISLFAQYDRALSDDDMRAMLAFYKNEFAI